jgi:hypothetical protein
MSFLWWLEFVQPLFTVPTLSISSFVFYYPQLGLLRKNKLYKFNLEQSASFTFQPKVFKLFMHASLACLCVKNPSFQNTKKCYQNFNIQITYEFLIDNRIKTNTSSDSKIQSHTRRLIMTHDFSLFDPSTYLIVKISVLIILLLLFLAISAAPVV